MNALTLNPLPVTLNPSKATSEKPKPEKKSPVSLPDRFPDFWEAYPKKIGKKACQKKWKSRRLDAKADMIIADVENRKKNDGQWIEGFAPNPETYINGDRWNDDVSPIKGAGKSAVHGGFDETDYGEAAGIDMDEEIPM